MNNHNSLLYRFGPFKLDPEEQLLLRNGEPIHLKPKQLALLTLLVQNHGHLLTRDELMKQLWPDSFVEDGSLTVGISKLRKMLGESRSNHPYIKTISRSGYRFLPCVTEQLDDDKSPHIKTLATNGKSNGAARRITIAVLPLKPIGELSDPRLCLGMADALITRLSKKRRVTVRPTSLVRNCEATQDAASAGRELGVEWVLDGSVQQDGSRVRFSLQIVDVRDRVLLWAGKFDEESADAFQIEDSICQRVINELSQHLISKAKNTQKKRLNETGALAPVGL